MKEPAGKRVRLQEKRFQKSDTIRMKTSRWRVKRAGSREKERERELSEKAVNFKSASSMTQLAKLRVLPLQSSI